MKRIAPLLALAIALAGCGGSAAGPAAGPATVAGHAAPVPDPVLQAELERLVEGFRGEVGVYVRHLPSGATAEIRADELFPTASIIKVPLLAALFHRVERGELRLEEELVFHDSLRYADYDLTAKFRDGETIPLAQLAFLMVALSDNTASLWIQALVGGGAAVNEWLAANGFAHTRVNSRTPGRRPDWEVYGWGQTTPREIARLLTMIRAGEAVSPSASRRMYRLLSKSYWDTEAIAALPLSVQAATKQGAVDRSRSEVLLVNSPAGDYVIAILTKEMEDRRWEPDNEGYLLLRDLSGFVYGYFNPQR